MIVINEEPALRLVTQPDHARLSAELLSLWRRDGLPERADRETLLFATREHDNGWREADAAPSADPDAGRPHDYTTLPAARRRELWLRGVERFTEDRPEASLLILEHGLAIHRPHRGDESWLEFFETLEIRRQELLDRRDPIEPVLESGYPMLALADTLSLALCHREERRVEASGYTGWTTADRLALEPFPLAGATTFSVPSRVIPDRRYLGDADLGGELATARWESFEVRVVPK